MEFSSNKSFSPKKHILYWKRCLKTFLPEQYTSMDSNRMMLGFFILSALDLLDALNDSIGVDERAGYISWIYSCQHCDGGFRGSPAIHEYTEPNRYFISFEPAHIANTHFALAALAILGDDFKRFNRSKCLRWLARMQKSDGSFGEQLCEDGDPAGTMSVRFNYCASAIRLMLRGREVKDYDDDDEDFNVPELIKRIYSSSTYDGGMSETPFHESHAGFTYCAIGTLYCLDQLPAAASKQYLTPSSCSDDRDKKYSKLQSPSRMFETDNVVRWLLFRQTALLEVPETSSMGSHTENPSLASNIKYEKSQSNGSTNALMKDHCTTIHTAAGFNGRCNKIADTCYAFWVGASLAMLGHLDLIEIKSCREYLLERTQHMIGGFGKMPGDPPDIYHSYLGLAALALYEKDGLTSFYPALCMSVHAATRFELLSI